jgi:transposase
MLRMLDRHAVQALLEAGRPTHQIARQLGVSARTIQRIANEPPVDCADDTAVRHRRRVGRPGVPEAVLARLRQLMAEDDEAPPLEYLRLLRLDGHEVGESTFYRIYRQERERLPAELMVRFEGVAGEFAQFDFGQVDVRLLPDGTKRRRVHFAAYRLKYSRWIWVEVVPDERIESLIRVLLRGFEHSGGVPLQVVFDRPKTVVTGYEDGGKRPIWHQALGHAVLDYGFAIELCAPRSPEQKEWASNCASFAM